MPSAVIGALRVTLGMDSAAFTRGLNNAQGKLKKFGQDMQRVGRSMSTYLTLPILAVGGAILNTAANFEAAMNRVRAVLRPTEAEFRSLRDLAAELGRTTQFSASQAADGLEMLARNGLRTEQIMGGAADATLKLAAAVGSDLAPAADVITDLMVNFNRTGAELGGIVDNIAGTLTNSKLGWEDYAQAVGQAAGAAGPLGMSLEDMNAAIAATAPSFASGAEAGTSFKGFLLKLVPTSNQMRQTMERLNLQFFDAQGNMKSLGEIAENLKTSLGGLTVEEQTDVLGQLFGQRTIRTALRLMDEGAEGIERIKKAIAGVSAAEMASTRLEGFTGSVTQLKSATEGLAIAIADSGLLEWATDFVTSMTEMVRGLTELNPEMLKWGTIIAGIAAAAGPALVAIGLLTAAIGAISAPVLAAVAAIGALGTIVGIVAGTVTQSTRAAAAHRDVMKEVKQSVQNALGTYGEMNTAAADQIQKQIELTKATIAATQAQYLQTEVMLRSIPLFGSIAAGALAMWRSFSAGDEISAALARVAELENALADLGRQMDNIGSSPMWAQLVEFANPTTGSGDGDPPFTPIISGAGQAAEAIDLIGDSVDGIADKTQSFAEMAAGAFSGIGSELARAFMTGGNVAKNALEVIIGKFAQLGEQLLDMATNQLISNLLGSLLGGGSMFGVGSGGGLGFGTTRSTPLGFGAYSSFAGGGYTGDGSRSGGIDGLGGFPAILHPQETVIDHTRGNGGSALVRIELGPGLEARMLQQSATQTVQIVNARVPNMIKQGAPAAVAQRQRNKY